MDELNAEWLAPRPGSDVAVMMGLAYTLLHEGLHDAEFLGRYCVGFDRFSAYLTGQIDGIVKTSDWAAEQSGLDAARIRDLARQMAAKRTMITTAVALQRADYGEQPLWMTVTLAAMLGQIGLPGGGFGIGYAMNGSAGVTSRPFQPAALPQGRNAVRDYIPVAMISDMLLRPGQQYLYNGQTRTFPDIKLVWWAGGNPFHHHQDLNLLRQAFQRPETIIVSEINWTATARHADIVLPAAASPERSDFAAGKWDNAPVPMPQIVSLRGEARTEFAIYAELARRLGNEHEFTEGRDESERLEHLWQKTRETAKAMGFNLPGWAQFLDGEIEVLPDLNENKVFLQDFRNAPNAYPLTTPSGLIEIFSERIASFDLPDCPGHPTWFPPRDVAGGKQSTYPLFLVSGQPSTRLHSQFDNGSFSLSKKIHGREPVMIHPADASQRGIQSGDVVELYNERGRCLAGAQVTSDVSQGCLSLATGAWYDPDFDAQQDRDRHGNPNTLTHDLRTSSLGHGPASHSALVELRKFEGAVPRIKAYDRPTGCSDENSV